MAKTVKSIEEQIAKLLEESKKQVAALNEEKKKLIAAEKEAERKAQGECEVQFGRIVMRCVEADWKRIDPGKLEDWLAERADKIAEACVGDELERNDALKRLRKNNSGRK